MKSASGEWCRPLPTTRISPSARAAAQGRRPTRNDSPGSEYQARPPGNRIAFLSACNAIPLPHEATGSCHHTAQLRCPMRHEGIQRTSRSAGKSLWRRTMSHSRDTHKGVSAGRRAWLKQAGTIAVASNLADWPGARTPRPRRTMARRCMPLSAPIRLMASASIASSRYGQRQARRARAASRSPEPECVCSRPAQRFLFAVSEMKDYNGTKDGSVWAYAIDPATGHSV